MGDVRDDVEPRDPLRLEHSDRERVALGEDRALVIVTHDPLDAMVLADRIVVIEHGLVVQIGTPAETRLISQLLTCVRRGSTGLWSKGGTSR